MPVPVPALTVAMETTSRSKLYSDVDFGSLVGADWRTDGHSGGGVALLVGNEVTGVDTGLLDAVDLIVEIPTFGVKNSLNVASALPIVLFEVIRQLHNDADASTDTKSHTSVVPRDTHQSSVD